MPSLGLAGMQAFPQFGCLEEASSLAMLFRAEPAKIGHAYALRANTRWCLGNLLGAGKDLHIAQQAMQTIAPGCATNMSEVLIMLWGMHGAL